MVSGEAGSQVQESQLRHSSYHRLHPVTNLTNYSNPLSQSPLLKLLSMCPGGGFCAPTRAFPLPFPSALFVTQELALGVDNTIWTTLEMVWVYDCDVGEGAYNCDAGSTIILHVHSNCALAAEAARMLLIPGVSQGGRSLAPSLQNLEEGEKHRASNLLFYPNGWMLLWNTQHRKSNVSDLKCSVHSHCCAFTTSI